MAMSAAIATLTADLISAAGSIDEEGIACWGAIATALCAGLPPCCSVFSATSGTPMVVVAGVVAPGTGGFTTSSAAALGAALAVASLSLDGEGIAAWLRIADVIVDWMGENATYGPAGLVGFVGTGAGAMTGVGQVEFSNEAIGPPLAAAADIQPSDTVGQTHWSNIGAAILSAVKTFGEIAPTSLTNPGTGGPAAGTGTFS